jgi:hypothetical protein
VDDGQSINYCNFGYFDYRFKPPQNFPQTMATSGNPLVGFLKFSKNPETGGGSFFFSNACKPKLL